LLYLGSRHVARCSDEEFFYQADAINRVFAASQSQVGTNLGTTRQTPRLKQANDEHVMASKPLKRKKKVVPGVGVESSC